MENEATLESMLNDELIERLDTLSAYSKPDDGQVDEIVKLYKLKHDEAQIRLEEERCKNAAKDRWFNAILTTAEIVVSVTFCAVFMKKGFEFEENGSFTSTTFRNLWSKWCRPKN